MMMIDTEPSNDPAQNHSGGGEHEKNLVRLLKAVIVSPDHGTHIDSHYVSSRFYNCFNYSLIAKGRSDVNLTVGVTSPESGDGKTLVASNLAVSLSVANQRETVLVDLNIRSPRLHSIFGTALTPGLVESLREPTVNVFQTQLKHLYVLPAGSPGGSPVVAERMASSERRRQGPASLKPSLGLEQVAPFRDVIYSLRERFEFVIVDMPPLQEPRIPMVLTHQMDGLLVVVDARKTRHQDIEKMFRRVNESQIIGFVLNRAGEDSYS